MKAGWCASAAAATYHLAVSSQSLQILLVYPCIQCLFKPLPSKGEISLWQAPTLFIASQLLWTEHGDSIVSQIVATDTLGYKSHPSVNR